MKSTLFAATEKPYHITLGLFATSALSDFKIGFALQRISPPVE
jgi:hypothetical protein